MTDVSPYFFLCSEVPEKKLLNWFANLSTLSGVQLSAHNQTMKSLRIRRIIIPLIVMFALWLGLDIFLKTQSGAWAATGFFFASIAKVLLMAGIVIYVIAAVIAFFRNRGQASEKMQAIHTGPIAALLIVILSVLVALLGVWDAAYGKGGSGEWSGLGDLLVFAISIPGGLVALLMAIFLKSFRRPTRVICIALALTAIGFAFLVPPLRKAHERRRFEEIMHSDATRKMIEEAKEKTSGDG